ncbi:Cytochrome P450 [Penicillium cosmopolitanum]|uniref:Self-sufficient cytochrome P450 monooxygenase CYP505E4 n=1 Tax=Penicillium cosmopolitanum TaxID=1131564 RepID=A0A9W9W026_9EURO|nr:Cytochrome P450 [Penicillium cosmopolitanum]KAJ5392426.1 Cytochrome P450 [Penicillium cosmopolitanum]
MSNEIPGPPGVPLLGNIFDVNPNETWNSLIKLSKQYGPIFKINALGHQIVFVGSVALLEEICDQKRFRKCVTGPVVAIRDAVHDSLFTAYDSESSWGIAHRIMAPYVTQQATEEVYKDMMEVVPDLTKKWSSTQKQKVLASRDLDAILVASCNKCFFNQRYYALDKDSKKTLGMVDAFEGATMEAMKRPTRPKLLNLLYQSKFSGQIKHMRSYCAEIMKSRKENPEQVRKDLLDAMLNNTDPESGEKLKDSQVIDEIISMYIGAATAANLLSYALYYLIKNPEANKKACEEIDSIVGDSSEIQLDQLKQLHYVEACLRESIRLSATAPGFNIEPIPSESKAPIMLAGGEYQIPHNQPMIAILNAVNRDPAVFGEDAEEFRPERVLGEKWDNLPAAAKKGFGNGKRECYGKTWAWQWSFFTLASIIKECSFEFADKNYKLTSNGAFSVKPLEFNLLMSPRKK